MVALSQTLSGHLGSCMRQSHMSVVGKEPGPAKAVVQHRVGGGGLWTLAGSQLLRQGSAMPAANSASPSVAVLRWDS